ncbi:MAG: hypothetical protein MMC23_007703 [Stictis urceolatum]|nr:hypothetical protein [Stictis urceolata]
MREVNFSIPNVNKASVGITTALYDRRALDCTSTLPLINSLNHLAYLTTSSARIRDILTVDGGVERLVCILKQGRSKEMMEMWKWNLAFQCVVNIGVRGSESVRTRVVEADMVPVIATLLDNYIQIVDKCREKADADAKRRGPFGSKGLRGLKDDSSSRQGAHERRHGSYDQRTIRRNAPPSIEIPQPFSLQAQQQQIIEGAMEVTPTPPQLALTSPQDRTTFARPHHHHHHHRHHHARSQEIRTPTGRHNLQAGAAVPSMDAADGFGLRPVRDADRLPSMIPALQNGITSQPESPTTPNAPILRPITQTSPRNRRRASLHQQQSSASGDSDDGSNNDMRSEHSTTSVVAGEEPMMDIQHTVNIEGGEENQNMLEAVETPMNLTVQNGSEGQEEGFNITHRTGMDGSIIATNVTPVAETTNNMALRPPPAPMNTIAGPAPSPSHNIQGRYLLDRTAPPGVLAATPRDEDVLMSLQLLAYVSKYCNLRTYFQKSHLVPKLKIGQHLKMLDGNTPADYVPVEESNEEEYLLPNDYNIFPLVEKFTVRHHSQDMQYWAGVVMRNLCRKDDSQGGIRQCAYYKCGKWEEWTRQFAKCRRCRRTKYCSKECQKNAWVFHRHWCQMANT